MFLCLPIVPYLVAAELHATQVIALDVQLHIIRQARHMPPVNGGRQQPQRVLVGGLLQPEGIAELVGLVCTQVAAD